MLGESGVRHLGQPKWITGSEQHFGWIRGGPLTLSPEQTASYGQNDPEINPTCPKSPKIGAGVAGIPKSNWVGPTHHRGILLQHLAAGVLHVLPPRSASL